MYMYYPNKIPFNTESELPEMELMVELEDGIKDDDFKKEWSFLERIAILVYLEEYFRRFPDLLRIVDGGKCKGLTISEKLGLPYTSSDVYAEMSMTNCSIYNPQGYRLNHFALKNNNIIVAVYKELKYDKEVYHYYRM